MAKRVFLSHSSQDVKESGKIAVMLVAAGIGVWFDDWEIAPGDSIIKRMNAGLANADIALLLWSSNAADSPWVKAEIETMIYQFVGGSGKKTIIVKLDDTPLPPLLQTLKHLCLTGNSEEDYREIVHAVTGEKPREDYAQALLVAYGEEFYDYQSGKVFPHIRCPDCGGKNLVEDKDYIVGDVESGDYAPYRLIKCKDCGWEEDEL